MKIFVNGSFDMLHTGHIKMLNYAKSLGTHLLVAIDSDDRISKLKGAERPVNPVHIRKCIMENLKAVDSVVVFNSDAELVEHIKIYAPDIMVKGSDWVDKPIIGSQHCSSIVFYHRSNNESTTKLIQSFAAKIAKCSA
jgi:D-beta-D-heptose 7-phosphate kinase/D-beta-D-heptose 1-phosphate adenosyltransferase